MQRAKQDDAKSRRRTIQELTHIKKQLPKAKNPNSLLADLVYILRREFYEEKIDLHLFRECMWEIYFYARDHCVFKEEASNDLVATYKAYLSRKSEPVARFLESTNKQLHDFCDVGDEDFLQAFQKGTFTGKTIMRYTKWLLYVIAKHPKLAQKSETVFRPFEVYIARFLKPRNYGRPASKKGGYRTTMAKYICWLLHVITGEKLAKYIAAVLYIPEDGIKAFLKPGEDKQVLPILPIMDPIMQAIDDIVEHYIQLAKPSQVFLNALNHLDETLRP